MSATMIATTALMISAMNASHSSGVASGPPMTDQQGAAMFLFVVWIVTWALAWMMRDEWGGCLRHRGIPWWFATVYDWASRIVLGLMVIAGVVYSIHLLIH